ncbi:alpha/beta hydrolase [uncultured Tateyamaria sp.]|uniref:alpha/beta hydrolase n=1 Tax=uncultured Tateyamaria sp. TaxID=455651 RepID=UPI002621B31F|nr:alpha/beta hydrolase [uncultured Tateyamaria sp.]
MRAIGKFIGRLLLTFVALIAAMWTFGPYEDATLTPAPGATAVDGDLDAHFAGVEAAYDDITPGVEKRVIWAGDAGARTDWSILYVHGFSATSEEIRPVPDQVAAALGANLIYTRLQGHGRSGAAMAEGSVQGWVNDLAEGLAAARLAGDRVLVMSTSTGGTLVAATAQNSDMMQDVAGLVFISPNFGLNNPLAKLLSWPAARYWLPPLAGAERSFEPRNAEHGTYWTTQYPSVAVMPMAALIDATVAMDHSKQTIPALFWFAEADTVVRPDITADIAAAWGGPTQVVNPVMGPQDDPQSHVIAGRIMSPGQTDDAVAGITEWVQSQVER